MYAAAREMESQIEYDENDMPILKEQKEIEPLPPVDHSTIEYYDFTKDFYKEDKEVAAMGANELMIMHKQLEIKVSGFDCPNPVCSAHAPVPLHDHAVGEHIRAAATRQDLDGCDI